MTTTIVYVLFLVLVGIDGLLTARILKAGGTELNPVMAWLIGRFGRAWPAVRMAVAAAAGAALAGRGETIWLAGLCACWTGIVIWNYRQIR